MNTPVPKISIRFSAAAAARARHGLAGVVAQYIQDLTHPRVTAGARGRLSA